MRTVLIILLLVGLLLAAWIFGPLKEIAVRWIPGMEEPEPSPTPPQHTKKFCQRRWR